MRLYRVTKATNPISHSDNPELQKNRTWIDDGKAARRRDALEKTGVDIRGPGRWFTSDLKELDFYVRDARDGAVVSYVDVPDDLAHDFNTYNIEHGLTKNTPHMTPIQLNTVFKSAGVSGKDTEYYLPLDWAEKQRILCTAKQLADNNFDVSAFNEGTKLSTTAFIRNLL